MSPRILNNVNSLLRITEELRQLRYNVIHGTTFYAGPDIEKSLLILDEPALNDYHQAFIDEYIQKFPNSYQMVDREFLMNAIYQRDKRYIYINRLSIINVEDGSMVPL